MEHSRSQQIKQEMAALEAEIQELAGMPFDIGDPKQLGDVLFEWLELPGGIRLEGGMYDVSNEILDKLYSVHNSRIAMRVLDWRTLAPSLEAAVRLEMTEEQLEEIRRVIREEGDFVVPSDDGRFMMASAVLAEIDEADAFASLVETFVREGKS